MAWQQLLIRGVFLLMYAVLPYVERLGLPHRLHPARTGSATKKTGVLRNHRQKCNRIVLKLFHNCVRLTSDFSAGAVARGSSRDGAGEFFYFWQNNFVRIVDKWTCFKYMKYKYSYLARQKMLHGRPRGAAVTAECKERG